MHSLITPRLGGFIIGDMCNVYHLALTITTIHNLTEILLISNGLFDERIQYSTYSQ